MAKVAFISHASEDAAIAATITDYLENNGVMLDRAARRYAWPRVLVGNRGRDRLERGVRAGPLRECQRIDLRQARGRAGGQQGQAGLPDPGAPGDALEVAGAVHLLGALDRRLEAADGEVPGAPGAVDLGRGRRLSGGGTGIRYAEGEWFLAGGKDQGPCRRDCCRELSSAPRLRWLVCVQIDR